jgi:hypothetical protein
MANAKIFYGTSSTGLLGDGVRLEHMISLEINRLLTDTANLRNSPFLTYAGSINGMGTDTVRVRKYGLGGRDSFSAATSENSDESANYTDIDAESADITVARQYLIRNISDLASMSGYGSQDLNPFVLASDMALSYETRFAELTADAANSFGTAKGSSSVTFSVDLFFEAISALHIADSNRGADGPYALVIHPAALNELQDSLRNETGNAISMMSATADMIAVKGKGYVGQLFGVDIYRSSHVNDVASAYNNFLLSPGAIGYADGIPTSLPSAVDFMSMGKVLVEMERIGASASTQVIGHAYLGFNILDDDKGLLVKSGS